MHWPNALTGNRPSDIWSPFVPFCNPGQTPTEIAAEAAANLGCKLKWKIPCWAVYGPKAGACPCGAGDGARSCPGSTGHTHLQGYPEHPSPLCRCRARLSLHLTCRRFAHKAGAGSGLQSDAGAVILEPAWWCRTQYTVTGATWAVLLLGQVQPWTPGASMWASLVTLVCNQPEPQGEPLPPSHDGSARGCRVSVPPHTCSKWSG